jgi:pantoate--beta-alanine ligase
MRLTLAAARQDGQRIGLVPTMGALHAGHLSLVEAAGKECQRTVVTIFVNPTQFGPGEDFDRYPRTLEADLAALSGVGADLVFAPASGEIYPPGYASFVDVGPIAQRWEGQFRPGHFRGVATIVLKLFHLAPADYAYFGRKDYQQALVIRRMIADLNVPITLRICPIVREPDGLAMSSRNRYLSADERRRALAIYEGLRIAAELARAGERNANMIAARVQEHLTTAGGMRVDYVALADPETLEPVAELRGETLVAIAAWLGKTRLIDNVTIEV